MTFQNENSCREKIKQLIKQIKEIPLNRPVNLMEVCGTHTDAVGKFGIRQLLPENVNLLSGPGCPVCVTGADYIDRAVALSDIPGVIITTFGDLFRVPGSNTSLQKKKAQGAPVRIVYSPLDALKIARENPGKNVIFLGVGFETTAPGVAACIKRAESLNTDNFFILPGFKTLPPALRKLALVPELKLDGLLGPGHLSVVTGIDMFVDFLEYAEIGTVVTGFEADDVLEGILLLLKMIAEESPSVKIQYSRAVKPEGNEKARMLMNSVFEPTDSSWRGLGLIPKSGLGFKKEYRRFDASARFPMVIPPAVEPSGCICGMILTGVRKPPECPNFSLLCTPANPLGACMVSSEGACAAYYRYHRR